MSVWFVRGENRPGGDGLEILPLSPLCVTVTLLRGGRNFSGTVGSKAEVHEPLSATPVAISAAQTAPTGQNIRRDSAGDAEGPEVQL